jgi:hypothetical protein
MSKEQMTKQHAAGIVIGGVLMLAVYDPLIASRFSGLYAIVGAMVLAAVCFSIGAVVAKALFR